MIYIIILDGAADREIESQGWKTPLETANTPWLDLVASRGQSALISVLPAKYVPETDSGVMALMGYDPLTYYRGRGLLESIGYEIEKKGKHFVGFRINIASLSEGKLERRTARGLSNEDLQIIQKALQDIQFSNIESDIHLFGNYRGIVSFYSDAVQFSGNVSNTDPGFVKDGYFSFPVSKYEPTPLKCYSLDDSQEAQFTASIVNKFSQEAARILSELELNKKRKENGSLEANCALFRDGGDCADEFPSFKAGYNRSLRLYGQLPCERGLAKFAGCEFEYTQALELQHDEDYLQTLAKKILSTPEDIALCHLKGPDEPGHDGDVKGKIEAIEQIDRSFIKCLVQGLNDSDILVITCDHATPCELRQHSNDKVPLVVAGNGFAADEQYLFGEKFASQGRCPVRKATELMPYICRGENLYAHNR